MVGDILTSPLALLLCCVDWLLVLVSRGKFSAIKETHKVANVRASTVTISVAVGLLLLFIRLSLAAVAFSNFF